MVDENGNLTAFLSDGDIVYYVVNHLRLMQTSAAAYGGRLLPDPKCTNYFSMLIKNCVDQPAYDAATHRVVTINEDQPVRKAAELMQKKTSETHACSETMTTSSSASSPATTSSTASSATTSLIQTLSASKAPTPIFDPHDKHPATIRRRVVFLFAILAINNFRSSLRNSSVGVRRLGKLLALPCRRQCARNCGIPRP